MLMLYCRCTHVDALMLLSIALLFVGVVSVWHSVAVSVRHYA
jgi:hypothetical protein